MYRLNIDGLTTPETFDSTEAAIAFAVMFFGEPVAFKNKDGILTARLYGGAVIVKIVEGK
jgi:hypothetical protein